VLCRAAANGNPCRRFRQCPNCVGESLPGRNIGESSSIEPGIEGLHIVRMDCSSEGMGQERTYREEWNGGHDLRQQGFLLGLQIREA
jgi:hypothetical protein